MLLSYTRLHQLVSDGVIRGVQPDAVNAASIDVRLGTTFLCEQVDEYEGRLHEIDLAQREPMKVDKIHRNIGQTLFLDPGEFILAHTMEEFHLPDTISAKFVLKSSIARGGLNQLSAVWCDAGWNGSTLTLELSNVTRKHRLTLTAGMFVGQMVFYEHEEVPAHASYRARGRYNGDLSAQGIKP